MSFVATLGWEMRLQARTTRFRAAAAGYLILGSVAPILIFVFARPVGSELLGPASYLEWTFQTQVFLTALLAAAVAGNRTSAREREAAWPVFASSAASNAALAFRRWLAIVTLVLPLSLVPEAVAAALALAAGATPDPGATLGGWLIHVAPVVPVVAGAWAALVAIFRREVLAALALILAVEVAGGLEDWTARRFGRPIGMSTELVGGRSFQRTVAILGMVAEDPEPRFVRQWVSRSERGFALREAFDQQWPRTATAVGLGLALALAAPLWLGRTRRDFPALRLRPDHPLRAILPWLYRLVQGLAPDAGLVHEARWACLGLLVLAASAGAVWMRQGRYLALADERYAAEIGTAAFPPTPGTLRLATWRSSGRLEPSGRVELEWTARFVHAGGDPAGHLAFTLNPSFAVEALSVAGRSLSVRRAWDRWLVELDPALEAGAEIEVRSRFTGRPLHVELALVGVHPVDSFATVFGQYRAHGGPWRWSDLALSADRPAVSPTWVELRPGDLGPVPRWTSWELTPPPSAEGGRGREVPEEAVSAAAPLELELAAPGRWLLASSCGHASRTQPDGMARLTSRCTLAPSALEVRGGRLVQVDDGGVAAVAGLPAHAEAMAALVPELRELVAASERAWPGLPGLDRIAVVENPAEGSLRMGWDEAGVEARGRLLLVDETVISSGLPLDPSLLVGRLLGTDLAARRPLASDQAHVIEAVLSGFLLRRMGHGAPAATIGRNMPPWMIWVYYRPIQKIPPSDPWLAAKIPPLLVELEHRLGRRAIAAAVVEFLDRPLGPDGQVPPGTVEELFATLARHGGRDLETFYRQHFLEGVVPVLRLEAVEARAAGARFAVSGRVQNAGSGEAVCPVVVKTETGATSVDVTVPSREAATFEIVVPARPLSVHLDPESVCFRRVTAASGAAERVFLGG